MMPAWLRARFARTGQELGFEASSVPTTVLGERVWIGWTDAIGEDLTAAQDRAVAGDAVPPGVHGTPGAGTCSQDALACEGTGPVVDVPCSATWTWARAPCCSPPWSSASSTG